VFIDSNIPMYVAGGQHPNRDPARDAVHAAVMINHRIEWIATFDAGFGKVSGISRFDLTG
jgi:predicted nucleic acid-binding protein